MGILDNNWEFFDKNWVFFDKKWVFFFKNSVFFQKFMFLRLLNNWIVMKNLDNTDEVKIV